MLLTIRNLPFNINLQDLKMLIQVKCGLTNMILDNLMSDGDGTMKVTVGIAEEEDAAILVRKINGLYMHGKQLHVEDVRKIKATDQPYFQSKNAVLATQSSDMVAMQVMQPLMQPVVPPMNNYMTQMGMCSGYWNMPNQVPYQNAIMGYGQQPVQYTSAATVVHQLSGNQQSPQPMGFESDRNDELMSQSHRRSRSRGRKGSGRESRWDDDQNRFEHKRKREPSPRQSNFREKRDSDNYNRERYHPDHERPQRFAQNKHEQNRADRADQYRPQPESEYRRESNDNVPLSKRQRFDPASKSPKLTYEAKSQRYDNNFQSKMSSQESTQYQSSSKFQQKPSYGEYQPRPGNSKFQSGPSNFEYEPRQPNPKYGPKHPNPKYVPRHPNPDYESRQLNTGYESRQPNPGYESRQPNPAYESRQPNPGYEYRQPNPGYESRQPNLGYESRQPNPGYESRQPNLGYESRQPNPGYESRQPYPAYESRQPNPTYDTRQPNPKFQPRPQSSPKVLLPNPKFQPRLNSEFQPRPPNPKFQPRPPNPKFQPRPPNPKFQPRLPNAKFQPRPSSPKFQPRQPNPKFQPRLSNPKFQPRSPKPKFQPRLPNSEFQPRQPNSGFQPRPPNPKPKRIKNVPVKPKAVETWIAMTVGVVCKEMMKNVVLHIDAMLFAKILKRDLKARLEAIYLDKKPQSLVEVMDDYRRHHPKESDKGLFDETLERATAVDNELREKRRLYGLKNTTNATVNSENAEGESAEAAPEAKSGASTVADTPQTDGKEDSAPASVPLVQKAMRLTTLANRQPQKKSQSGIKSEIKMQKKENKMIFQNEELLTCSLNETMKKALDVEVDEIAKLFLKECESPSADTAALARRLTRDVAPDLKTVLIVNLSKRFLDHGPVMLRVFCTPKSVTRSVLAPFAKRLGVTILKKSARKPMYLASCRSYDHLDLLCAQGPVICNGQSVTFKPLQLAGPPKKITKSQIKKQRDTFMSQQIGPNEDLDEFVLDDEDFMDYGHDLEGDEVPDDEYEKEQTENAEEYNEKQEENVDAPDDDSSNVVEQKQSTEINTNDSNDNENKSDKDQNTNVTESNNDLIDDSKENTSADDVNDAESAVNDSKMDDDVSFSMEDINMMNDAMMTEDDYKDEQQQEAEDDSKIDKNIESNSSDVQTEKPALNMEESNIENTGPTVDSEPTKLQQNVEDSNDKEAELIDCNIQDGDLTQFEDSALDGTEQDSECLDDRDLDYGDCDDAHIGEVDENDLEDW